MVDLGAYRRYRSAVEELVKNRRIRDRLEAAAQQVIPLLPNYLPDDVREEFKRVLETLSWIPAESDEGTLRRTLDEMSDEETEALATSLVTISFRVAEDYAKTHKQRGDGKLSRSETN